MNTYILRIRVSLQVTPINNDDDINNIVNSHNLYFNDLDLRLSRSR